jgi:hypothetical protein
MEYWQRHMKERYDVIDRDVRRSTLPEAVTKKSTAQNPFMVQYN